MYRFVSDFFNYTRTLFHARHVEKSNVEIVVYAIVWNDVGGTDYSLFDAINVIPATTSGT